MADACTSISELRPTTKGHDLVVKVLDAKLVVDRQARGPKGSALKIAECLVGDASGTIVFSARNEQAEVSTKGAVVSLTNARVDMYRGSMRLVVDQAGKVEAAEAAIKPNEELNMSLIEFELIPVP